MKEEILNKIVNHFLDLYKEEIERDEITDDCIREWWWNTRDQYGYDSDDGSEVYPEIEKAIWRKINLLEKTYIIKGGGQYVRQCVENETPVEYIVRATNYKNETGCSAYSMSTFIWALSLDDLKEQIKDWTDEEIELIEVDEY